jgi:basic amino acid/polyamine antiporter, APA family
MGSESVPAPARANLKRTISLGHLVGIEVGQAIGAGIFSLAGVALSRTGPSLPLAFVAAAALVSVAMVVLARLGSRHPVSGGTYYYGSRMFSPVASFAGVWAYVIGAVLGMFPLYALTGAAFLAEVVPGLPRIPAAVGLLAVFYLANLLGARIAAWVQAVLVVVLLVALAVFVGAGLPAVRPANLSPLFPGGVAGFAVAAAILTFTVLGPNAAVELGDEIVDPRRAIPVSFAISLPVVTVAYVLIGLVMAGVRPWQAVKDPALTSVSALFLPGWLELFFVVGGGFLAVATTLNATFLWGTKSLLVVAEDGLLPRWLAAVSPRLGTPHRLLSVIFVLSAASLLLVGERIATFAVLASLGGIVIFVPVMGAALRLWRKEPARGRLGWAAPVGGLVLCLLVVAILIVDLSSHRDGLLFLGAFVLWTAGGAVWAALRLRGVRLAGRDSL